jgi:hypothetical protein
MEFDTIYNIVEIGLWTIIGLGFVLHAVHHADYRRLALCTGIAFVLFGISDAIELQTGSWWDPWWLFAMKAACVTTFLTTLIIYLKTKRQTKLTEA